MMRGCVDKALADHAVGVSLAHPRSMLLPGTDAAGSWVDYETTDSSGLLRVLKDPAYQVLADCYYRLSIDELLLGRPGAFL